MLHRGSDLVAIASETENTALKTCLASELLSAYVVKIQAQLTFLYMIDFNRAFVFERVRTQQT